MRYVIGVISLLVIVVCEVGVAAEPGLSMFGLGDLKLKGSLPQLTETVEPSVPLRAKDEVILEAYGDSVTAGFLSNTTAMGTESLASVSKIMSDLAMFVASGDRKFLDTHEFRDKAWPAVLSRLLAKDGHRVRVMNLAVSGAVTSEMVTQVNAGPKDADGSIAFFFIGHNDLCETPHAPDALADHYEADYDSALAAWDQNHHNSNAYLVRVGDVQRVFRVLRGHVWYQGKGHAYSCEDSWQRFFPYCRFYQKKLADGSLDAFLTPRIEAMNHRLGEIAEKWDRRTANGNHFQYVTDSTDEPYEKPYFAVDCYHLSSLGQRKLAEGIYRNITK